MKMVLGVLLCSEHPLEAFLVPQRVEIVVEDHISQAAEYLDYNDVSLREHARLSIGKLNIENAFAILCAEHPKPQVMFASCFFDLYKEKPIRKVSRPAGLLGEV
jgi:hypothetical protein